MNVDLIVNALAIRAGGGLQKTLSLMDSLSSNFAVARNTRILCSADSTVCLRATELGLTTVTARPGQFGRLISELQTLKNISVRTVVFNIGGLTPIRATKNLINVNECAFSNLFYPEIDFWNDHHGVVKAKLLAVDRIRRWGVGNADFWVFQTPAILDRALNLFDFPKHRCKVVLPSPSSVVSVNSVDPNSVKRFRNIFSNNKVFLFLGGTNKNKRLHNLPEIALEMLKTGGDNFLFVLTMNENDPYYKTIRENIVRNNLDPYFANVGIVPPTDVASLINCSDVMCNFSRLESFSNNFVEAWQMKKPLVVTNADWSQAVAESAAVYVDPDDIYQTASALNNIATNERLVKTLTSQAEIQLSKFPTPATKLINYIECFEQALCLGKIKRSEKPPWSSPFFSIRKQKR